MTSASYETSTFANPSPVHDIRRSLGGTFSSVYDSPYPTARRRSPSPGPSSRRYGPYDSYIPRGGPGYRSDDHPNIYRPNTWRPERYSSRSPSPDRYDRSRSVEVRFWDASSRWQPWQDRRSSPSPPPLREKPRRDTMAERMFEPSDSWKQSHVDRSGRYEALEPPSPRFPDYRARPARDYSPQKSPTYPPVHGDTYRPYSSGQSYREPHIFVRPDTYRPQYDDSTRRSPRSVDKSNTDAFYPRRPSSHDHDDSRSSTSIASTPPRRALNSPLPDPHITDCNVRRHSPSCGRASPAHSVARSRASSISSEPPLKRLKSRSSSRSSASSRPDKSAISAPNGLIVSPKPNRESIIQQTSMHVLSRDPDRLGSTSDTLVGKGSTHPEPLPHELPHVDTKPAHPVMNGELNGPPLASNFPRSPPNLLSGEDIEMSPPGLISSHALPSDMEFAFLGNSAGKGTEIQSNQTSPLFDEVQTQSISPATPSPALKSVGAAVDDSPASATATPSPESKMLEKDIDVGSPGTLTGDTPLLKSVPQVIATESVGSPSCVEAGEQLLTPALDVEQPATWFYGRPSFADSTAKALRFVVLTRLQCDRQTRDERVVPVLRANRAIREPSLPSPIDAQDKLFQEFAADLPRQERMALHSQSIRSSLSGHFLERETALREKQQKLREEYLELHQQWIAQCARLDNVSKGGIPEESMPASAGGRSTRRSAAVLGDAVRSDLEMEQIIANLGMEELTDPSYLAIKNVAKIPDMVSVIDGRGPYSYDDTNNLLDNPAEFYSSSSALDLWTEEERIVFKERYAAHPKQFGLIAQHLPNKTAAQCVTYYYLHKPHVDFRKAIAQYGAGRRRRNGRGANKQKGNALLADIRRHDDEVLAAHPTSSAVPSKRRRAAMLRSNVEPRRNQSRRGTVQPDQTPTSSGTTPDPEADEQKRRRRSTAVARSSGLAQEEVEPTEPDAEAPPPKQTRRPRKPRARAVPTPSEEATPVPELPDYSKSSSIPISWSKEDKSLFLELLSQQGDNVHCVTASMPRKTSVQVSSCYGSQMDELASVSLGDSAL